MNAHELLYNISKVLENLISGTTFSRGGTIWPYAYQDARRYL